MTWAIYVNIQIPLLSKREVQEVGLKLRFVFVEEQVGTVVLKWRHLKSGFF
jgi:hypothetical protein